MESVGEAKPVRAGPCQGDKPTNRKQEACPWCGDNRHTGDDCSKKMKFCGFFKCRRKGHTESVCWLKDHEKDPEGTMREAMRWSWPMPLHATV